MAIKVADSEKGMTSAELKKLQRSLEDEKNMVVTDSTGNLGYRIIRDFVTKLNGRIMVESALDTGTTVTILFPII